MKKPLIAAALMLCASSAAAQQLAAPETMLMFGGDVFSNGQSGNLASALNFHIDSYWESGACTDTNNYAHCDILKFGLSGYPAADCNDSLTVYTTPSEDGGGDVKDRISTIQTESGNTFCDNPDRRHTDSGLRVHRENTFPGGIFAPDPVQELWWQTPHLNMLVLGDVPQLDDGVPDGRIKKTLTQACLNREGGISGQLPSIPTWVMMFRKSGESPVPFANLLAAAGGTGECCYGNDCDEDDEDDRNIIDVCEQIQGRTDTQIRNDLADGRYDCGPGSSPHMTGALAFPDQGRFGQLKDIRCHLVGEGNTPTGCDESTDTNLLGIFSCIRQVARGTTFDDMPIFYCPEDYVSFRDECTELTRDDVSFIDDRETIFIMNDLETCDGTGSFVDNPCPLEGSYCVVDGAQGRCALGQYECINNTDTCTSMYEPMPEICNGLDDDCNGVVDNMSTSWDEFPQYTLPNAYEGLDCQQNNVCTCPEGHTDSYSGADFTSYLDSWEGVCACGEGLSEPAAPAEPAFASEPQASCANAATTPSALVLILLSLLGLGVRRRMAR